MLRPLQSTSSHISISISIFLLNIQPAFTSRSPRSSVSVFPAPHFLPVPTQAWPATRLSVAWNSLLCSGHPGSFPSQRSQLRWCFMQRSDRDSFTAAPSRPGCSSSSESCSLSQTVVYIISFYGPSLKDVFLTRGLILAHCSLLHPELCQVNGNRSVQLSSVAQSCLTLCDPMDCSTPGLPVHHQLQEFTQTHVHRVGDAIQPSVIPFSSQLQSFPASGSFPRSQFFTSGGQSIGISALASVLPMNIQDSFPLGWTHWISL